MFQDCPNLTKIIMTGDVSNLESVEFMFDGVPEGGTFYYNPEYDYSKIIEELPRNWTSIPLS